MKRSGMRRLAAFAAAAALVLGLVGCGGAQSAAQGNTEPVDLSVWTYYNGDQLESFNKLVETFNDTVGKEKNITVESYSQGSVNDLEAQVMAAAQGKVGASAMPNIFMAYADTAYAMDQMGELADLAPYFTDEERAAYLDSYLTEGDFDDSGSIKIFPVAKSTELLFLNDTDWQTFAAATGAQDSDLETVEGLVKTAEAYYNWTDAQTDTPNDGKALFGRDAMANYMLIGAKELGDTIFDVKDGKMTMGLSEDAARKLWDNYYVPYIKGWAAASGRFRSDDIKIGSILAYIGSNSSATYFPTQVMLSDTESHDIELKVLPTPHFEGGKKVAVQQGAGMAVAKTTDAEVEASVVFLKWFTQPENNIAFAVGSGYLPVTHAANDMDAIHSSGLALTGSMENVLTEAVDAVNTNELYTTKAFEGGTDARSKLNYSMSDLATADRATVEERLAAGESAEEAEAEFLTDAYFEAWYQSLCDALSQYEAEASYKNEGKEGKSMKLLMRDEAKGREHTIFVTIFSALMVMLAVVVMLMASATAISGVTLQLDENAVDILDKQVENRAGYIQDQLRQAQELTDLSTYINETAQQMLDDETLSLKTLDSCSSDSLPLLLAAAPRMLETLRSKRISASSSS